jgi:hypothetical protein
MGILRIFARIFLGIGIGVVVTILLFYFLFPTEFQEFGLLRVILVGGLLPWLGITLLLLFFIISSGEREPKKPEHYD